MDSNTGDAQGGEKVWLDYDQAELDLQYEQRSLVPDGDRYVAENLLFGRILLRHISQILYYQQLIFMGKLLIYCLLK